MNISIENKPGRHGTEAQLAKLYTSIDRISGIMDKYGKRGVSELSAATPVDTGGTANSWSYSVKSTKNGKTLIFKNSNIQNGVPIAIIIQYGHGTRNGGYVQGRDYINPTIRPIFDGIVDDIWREMTT